MILLGEKLKLSGEREEIDVNERIAFVRSLYYRVFGGNEVGEGKNKYENKLKL